jgi:uncharacterized protein YuzE
MRQILRGLMVLVLLIAAAGLGVAQAKAGTLKCVGLYSETDAGYISYRVGTGAWVVVKVGDTIPANGEIRINVDRDWIEVIPATNPNAVYEIDGPDSGGEVIKKVADILKGKPRAVSFPKVSGSTPDPKFKNKLVVTGYLGRQVYLASADADDKDIKYGDVLDIKGKVMIIAINNTITLMNASGGQTNVIGPLKFDVEKVLTNQKLYKFLNVPR